MRQKVLTSFKQPYLTHPINFNTKTRAFKKLFDYQIPRTHSIYK